MSDPILRPATLDDRDALRALLAELHPDQPAPPDGALEALLAHPGVTLILAECDGVPRATCTLAVVPNLSHGGRPYGVIENVVTAAAHRRRGLGRAVLAEAVRRARAAGCYKVHLATGSRRESTLAFYDSAGFTRDAKTYFEIRDRLPAPAPRHRTGA